MMPVWTKLPGGVEIAQIGDYQLSVGGSRGNWRSQVWKRGTAAACTVNSDKTKADAKQTAVLLAHAQISEDERRRRALLDAPISYAKLAVALDKARASANDARRGCTYDGSKAASFDDVDNMIDTFVATLIHSLDPDPK
jgi:hypothetical protein